MKLLILTKLYPTIFEPLRGIFNKNFLNYFLKYFENEDIKVHIVRPTPFFKRKCKKEVGFGGKLTTHFPQILTTGRYFKKYHHILYFYIVVNYIKKLNKNFDLIYSHWLYPDSFVAVKIAKILNKPVIVHFHGSDVNNLLYDKKLRSYNEYTLNNATKIVVVSLALKNKILEKYPALDSKIEVIYNGVNFEKYRDISEEESSSILNLTNEKRKKIVFVGNLIKEKGLLEIIEAAKITKETRDDFVIFLVGKGNTKDISCYKKLISKNSLDDNFVFVGPVSNDMVRYYFKIAHFSILPSYNEGLPLVVLESILAKTFVIATNVGGLPEIITDDSLGKLIAPKSGLELSKSMIELLSAPKKCPNLEGMERFDIVEQVKKSYNLYKNIIEKHFN